MNLWVIVFLFLLFFAGSAPAFSQEAPIVAIIPAEPVSIARGQTAQVTVTATIRKGFHIQANPAADEFLIPTSLTVKAGDGLVPGTPVYPPGRPYKLQGSTDDLLTYEDEVIISLPVTATAAAPNGELTGELRFQPCDDRRCFFPRTVPVVIPVKIVD